MNQEELEDKAFLIIQYLLSISVIVMTLCLCFFIGIFVGFPFNILTSLIIGIFGGRFMMQVIWNGI